MGRKTRIFVAEDEAIVALDLKARLEDMGYEHAGTAAGGPDLADRIRASAPDLVLMDVRLGEGTDGIEVSRELTQMGLPVVFLTAYADDATLERAKRAAPFGYILKPFEDRELKMAIEMALYKHAADLELRRINRLYAVLSEVNQAIVRSVSADELLPAICRIIVEQGKFRLAWVGRFDPGTKRILPVAAAGDEGDYVERLDLSADPSSPRHGLGGKALLSGAPCVVHDFRSDPGLGPWQDAAAKAGIRSGTAVPIPFRGPRPWGTLSVYSAEPGFFKPGEVRLIEEVASDIAFALGKLEDDERRRAAEKHLREALDHLERAQRAAQAGIWDWDITTGALTWSPELFRILGLDPAAGASFDAWRRALHPEDREEAEARLQAAIDSRERLVNNCRIILPSGEIRWIAALGDTTYDPEGKPLRMSGICLDVTAIRQTEADVRWKSALLEALANATLDGILVVDPNGRKVFQNRRCIELWGIPEEVAANADDRQQLEFVKNRAKDPEAFVAKVAHLYSHPQEVSRDEVEFKNGVVLDRYSAPVIGADGTYYGRIWQFHDITGRKRAEAERMRLEEQLRQIQKIDAIGRLAGGVAHDFNNLLTAISGYAQLLREDLPPQDPRRAYLDEILKAAEHSAALTRRLLAFGRKQILNPRVLDLNAVVAGMEGMLRRLIGEHIELTASLDPALGRVKADPGQIEQVILNLAVNARDAMPGGGRLRLETRNVEPGEAPPVPGSASDPSQPWVELSVADTGLGMSDEVRAHLFEPFFTTKEAGKGTGLGLSTVHGIVQQSGGRIAVASRPGEGTVFRIFLPRVETPLDERRSVSAGPAPGGRETVLIAEDSPVVLSLAREILRSRGYEVLEAADGKAALEKIRDHPAPIHLLLTDLVMPGMSGHELAILASAARPGLRILAMSGYDEEAVARQGRPGAPGAFLPKPFTPEELAAKVREVLDGPAKGP